MRTFSNLKIGRADYARQPTARFAGLRHTPYTSGHSTFSGTAADVLKGFIGTDRIQFVLPSETACVANRTLMLHTVKNEAASVAIVPSPPQSIFQLYNFSTGGEGQGEGEFCICFSASFHNKPVSPLFRPPATFSPDLGGNGVDLRKSNGEPGT